MSTEELPLYIVIQTCRSYRSAIRHLLEQLVDYGITTNLIVVENQNESEVIVMGENIYIQTTQNNYDLTMYGKIHEYAEMFTKYDLFLFLHDTIELTTSFRNNLTSVVHDLRQSDFDYAPLCRNFQTAQGFATKQFIQSTCEPFLAIESISKMDAVHWEWDTGPYAHLSLKKLSKKTKYIGEDATIVDTAAQYLDSPHPRTKLHIPSVDIYKYYVPFSREEDHPQSL